MTEEEFLKNYDYKKYDRPSVTVDIVAFGIWAEDTGNYREDNKKTISLLLIKRGEHPYMGKWALPGGFLRVDDKDVETCAFREIEEESKVKPQSLMPIGVFSEKNRDPRGWIISNAFVSVISEEGVKPVAGDDAKEAKWFKVGFEESKTEKNVFELSLECDNEKITATVEKTKIQFGRAEFKIVKSEDLAFDHAKIIATAFSVIRNLADSEDFNSLFDFMPDNFTLTDLQRVHQTILGDTKRLLAANFRRKVEKYVVETEKSTSGVGHRPAVLYRKATSEEIIENEKMLENERKEKLSKKKLNK